MDLQDEVKRIIHETTVNNTVYSGLYFGTKEVKKVVNFSFNFNYPKKETNLEDDVKFLLDNIIAKTFELNYKIDYKKYHRTSLGNFIHYDDERVNNPFIVNEYVFLDSQPFGSIEDFIEEIEVLDNGQRYQINWKVPILELDKSNIEVK